MVRTGYDSSFSWDVLRTRSFWTVRATGGPGEALRLTGSCCSLCGRLEAWEHTVPGL